jgi:PTH1 family peptidyl-tRNA hydrolase
VPERCELVVGLGNPGPEYHATRHNVGQTVVDLLARRLGGRFQALAGAVVAEAPGPAGRLLLAKPVAFMSGSGAAVARLLAALGLAPADIILTYDDLDLPLGTVRARQAGRHGGHNGVRSVLEALGTEDVRRVKVGIGRPAARQDVVEWVLGPFSAAEREALPAVLDRAADLVLALARAPRAAPGEPPRA